MIRQVTWSEYAAGAEGMEPVFDQERVQRRTLYHRMVDIWGEVGHVKRAWRLWSDEPTGERRAALGKHLDALHRACHHVYDDATVRESLKYTLRIAEWEVYDFCLWGNRFRNTEETVSTWFDQWCFQRNPSLRTL